LNIAWSAFSWEAFATLTTGVFAVVAASWVGYNQVKIQKRQTQLIENELKIQLLEKRSICVTSMRKIHHAWHREMRLSDEERRELYNLSEDALLLYPTKVSKSLDEAVSAIFRAKHHYDRSERYRTEGKTKEADQDLDAAFAEEDKIMKIMPNLLVELIEYTRVDAWE
jgi:hypothetical protein